MKSTRELDVLALDLEFNKTGILKPKEGSAGSVTMRGDRIALTGTTVTGYYGWLLNRDGSPSDSFGSDGRIEDKFSDLPNVEPLTARMKELETGEFLVSGAILEYREGLPLPLFFRAFARYDSRGVLDRSFGDQGKTVIRDWPMNEIYGVVDQNRNLSSRGVPSDTSLILKDGSIFLLVLPGVAKLTPDGKLDLSFGSGGGLAPLAYPEASMVFHGVSVLEAEDGSLIVDGSLSGGGKFYGAAVKLTRDGQLDKSFGENGWFVDVRSPQRGGNGILPMPDDEVLLYAPANPNEACVAVCLDPNGKYSSRFNAGQPLVLRSDARCGWTNAQSDAQGHVILGGFSGPQGMNPGFLLSGFDRTGQPDTRIGPQGWITGMPGLILQSMLVQDDGKILLSFLDARDGEFHGHLFMRLMGFSADAS